MRVIRVGPPGEEPSSPAAFRRLCFTIQTRWERRNGVLAVSTAKILGHTLGQVARSCRCQEGGKAEDY